MLPKIRFLFVLPFVLLFVGVAHAQGPGPRHSQAYWQVAFWNNTTLSGEPDLTAAHQAIDWDWGYGSPDPAIHSDRFSARWSRYIEERPGTYRFTATSDDGIRVYVDNQLVINGWQEQAATTYVADVPLAAGHHSVVVEYYEQAGLARVKVSWAPLTIPEPIRNWRGEYYANLGLSGTPALVRDDDSIDFNWGTGSPSPVVPADRFSVRWTRSIHFEPGQYTFSTTTDDGVRLWVNGHLLIDVWRDQSATTYSGTIYLSGSVTIKMEYYENGGLAVAKLVWGPASGPPPPPPPPPPSSQSIIVDDQDAGFVKGGSATGWRTASEGYGQHLTWTQNNDRTRPQYNWARWYPNLDTGRYEVFVFIPQRYSTTGQARYWVSHYDGYTLRIVNQAANYGWVSLGTYRFRGNGSDYVSLADITYEPYLSRIIAFDAVKWDRR